ncbi:DUF421 domain-containing protein [Bacillus weihaiensis]|uniref:DUF421 domain-containing protein n=1 Tax=Bacillus weihaiensis TaxID=1547283 RepID=UPI002355FBB4|nr:DUF421 domain-containing protein [Bacillus weihaiensis]
MDYSLIWKAVLIVLGGTILLRIAGRKSISQMTLAQVVIMIGLGSLLVQPIVGKNVWSTIVVGLTLVLTLVFVEFVQIKSDKVEKFISGKAKTVIRNGQLQEDQLKKLRISVDLLEMKLRQANVTKIEDVKYATLETNGQIGFELKDQKKPVTKEDLTLINQDLQMIKQALQLLPTIQYSQTQIEEPSLFTEVSKNKHQVDPPEYLK